MGIGGEQQDTAAGGEHEHGTDKCLLDLRPALLGEIEDQRPEQRSSDRHCLYLPSTRLPVEVVCRDETKTRHLSHRQVKEDNAALQHPAAQRHMGGRHQ